MRRNNDNTLLQITQGNKAKSVKLCKEVILLMARLSMGSNWICVVVLVGYWQLPRFILDVVLAFWKSKLPRTRKLIECSATREGRVEKAGVAGPRISTSRNLNRDKSSLVLVLEDEAQVA